MKRLLFLLWILFSANLFASGPSPAVLPKTPKTYLPPRNAIYKKGWIDFNKNGRKDMYEDPAAPIENRIDDLLGQMTVDEKTCQMVTLYGYGRVLSDDLPTPEWKERLWKDGMGAIDEHLNGFVQWGLPPSDNPYVWPASRHAWALNEVQRFFVEETRLGIPVDFTNEGIRGVEAYKATNFPTQLGLGHTWNRELIYKVGYITGREGRLLGYTNVYAPILDVGRDQRWGRYEEVYGESPYLVAELAIQAVKGIQQDNQCAATSKHYIAYSNNKGAREGMARVDPQMSPREVENIHVYPWKRVIGEAGLLGAMCAYNDYDGFPVESSRYWLTERLRNEFGFKGYVVSDSDAVEYLHDKHKTAKDMKESVLQSVAAGLNVRCTFDTPDSYVLPLRELIADGALPMETIDERVRDILRVKFQIGLFDAPYQTDLLAADREVNCAENQAIALQASRESLVLLKNENNTLPLDRNKIKRIAVCGPNADDPSHALTHYGPLAVEVVSILQGIRDKAGQTAEVTYTLGCELVDEHWPESELFDFPLTPREQQAIDKAVEEARNADVAVVVLGGGQRTCGENKSRSSLDLPGRQNDLLQAIHATGTPVILVLINGRPLSVNWADRYVPAILEAWYPGSQGGTAVAEALFGDYNPGGKLTVTFPKTVGQIPFNFPCKPFSQSNEGTRANGALYPFGFGLSYTTFTYSDLKLDPEIITPHQPVTVTCNVTNSGDRFGDEVVQLYTRDLLSTVTTYEKNLRGFERVALRPGETWTVRFTIPPRDLQLLNADNRWVVEPGDFRIMVGASSEDIRLSDTLTVVPYEAGRIGTQRRVPAETPLTALFDENPETIWNGKRGDYLTFPLEKGARPELLSVAWAAGTPDATFEIQYTDGGGQFLTLYRGTVTPNNRLTEYRFPKKEANALRVTVTSGTASVSEIRFGKETRTAR